MLVLIDNYDSFTFNLAHRLGELGVQVKVIRNDKASVAELERLAPERVVISPGPGRPESAGVSVAAIQAFSGRVPILGVCLGHQALATAFGGTVERARAPVHGKTSLVSHDASRLFTGVPNPFEVGRYHSLAIAPSGVPHGFVVSARAVDDDTIMAVRHESRPVFGVQFHPESVLTPLGQRVLQNFLEAR